MKEIGIYEFYKLIGDEEEGSRETEKNRGIRPKPQKATNEQTKPQAEEQETAMEHAFGTFEAFTNVLESILRGLGTNSSSLIRS
jgi:hypothetical protein